MKQWHEYTSVTLNKIATIIQPLGKGRSAVWECKHSELAAQLAPFDTVTFNYVYGQEKRRLKQLEELGFELLHTVWRNAEQKTDPIKQIWTRKGAK